MENLSTEEIWTFCIFQEQIISDMTKEIATVCYGIPMAVEVLS